MLSASQAGVKQNKGFQFKLPPQCHKKMAWQAANRKKRKYRTKTMKKYLVIGILVVLGIGFLGLLTIDIPAPTEDVERVIPDEDFDQ